ncbi:ATP-dependent DNA helicase PIF1 [Bienertia sinuspersici]
MLLGHVRAPLSHIDLMTVNGHKCAIFQEAVVERGLVEHNDILENCIDEAIEVQMPQTLRRLFVTLLIFCHPTNPRALWEKYYYALSDDYHFVHPASENEVFRMTCKNVEKILESIGKSLEEFGLGHLQPSEPDSLRIIRDIQDAIDAPIPQSYIQARKKLNAKQKEAYKVIVQHVKAKKSGMFFIDGPRGTGKTFLYCALYAKIRMMNKIVLPTASSGIAAANLPNGRTAHSHFKLPIDLDASLTCNVPKQGALAVLLKEASVIIWDEAPMANKASIHALDLLLKDLLDSDTPFGRKIVVLGGDFRQVLPVVPHKTQREAVEASLVSSPLWPHFLRFHLEENMRAREDPSYASFLLSLGDGKLQEEEIGYVELMGEITIPFDEETEPLTNLLQEVFSTNNPLSFNADTFMNCAVLAPKSEEGDMINSAFIQQFDGDMVTYKSFDILLDDNCNIYPIEFLHTLCPGGMSPHELLLKKDCPVILLRNIDPTAGLCNGTRFTCKKFFPNMILCEIATGWYKGQQTMLPRIKLRPSASSNYPFQFQRAQFPIKLSFAMTINKSQGQRLDRVGIYLRQPCFSHGQLYVALSRARKALQVKVISKPTT